MDFGGSSASDAYSSASSSMANAISQGITATTEARDQARSDLSPWRSAGQTALSQYAGLLGLSGYSAVDPTSTLQSTPGYQWSLNQGIGALDRSAASKGLLTSGAQQKGLLTYGMGLADTTYNNYLSNLSGLTSGGLSAAGGQATTSTSAGSDLSNLYSSLGESQANATLGSYSASQSSNQNNFNNLLSLGGLGLGMYSSGMFA
jgi:hypothetical protein